MRIKHLFTVSTAAILLTVGISNNAHAGHSCRSEFTKAQATALKLGPKVAKGVCQLTNKDDQQAAEKCLEQYEKFVEKLQETLAKTGADNPRTVGPRPLGNEVWKTGNLQAERTFIGATILSESHRIEIQREPASNTNKPRNINVEICYVDDNGNEQKKKTVSMPANKSNLSISQSDVSGLHAVVLLKTPFKMFAKGNRYKIQGVNGKDEPKSIKLARELARSGGGNKSSGGKLAGRTFLIQNVHSGKALTAAKAAKQANIYQWATHNKNTQRWTLKPGRGEAFNMVSKANGMCADLQWANKNEGGNVFLWPCANNAWNMEWEFRPTGKRDEYLIYNKGSNKCLEVEKWYKHDGGNIVQRSCTNNANQRWQLRPR